MVSARSRLRTTALLLGGALAVHELRYTLSPAPGGHELAGRHTYLLVGVPLVAALLAFLLARVLVSMSAGRPRHDSEGAGAPGSQFSRQALWLLASGSLVALFVAQETLEALLSGGSGDALALFGIDTGPGVSLAAGGGWLVLPLAAGLGAVVTLALGIGEGRLDPVSPQGVRLTAHPRPGLVVVPRSAVLLPACVLARHLAGRAPPAASTV
jgi:hypothetical protein